MTTSDSHALILTTTDSKSHAKELAAILLKARLAACVNIVAVDSLYSWNGKIEEEREFQLIIKSRSALCSEVCETIKAHHHYELPEILFLKTTGSEAYISWIDQNTRKSDGAP